MNDPRPNLSHAQMVGERARRLANILEHCRFELEAMEYDDVNADEQAALATAKGFCARAAAVLLAGRFA